MKFPRAERLIAKLRQVKAIKETEDFFLKMNKVKGVVDEYGNVVDPSVGTDPLVDHDGRSVVLTVGKTIEE